tara:strand:+ start:1572 stop:1856 length:285 start_codon:yes stop_codon:yes gene_type:complete
MEIKLESGRSFKIKEDISLDERDELMDSIEYDWDKDGGVKGVKMMNKTITKWLRTCLDGGCSDKELVKWSMSDRTSAFLKIQEELTLGEGKASK